MTEHSTVVSLLDLDARKLGSMEEYTLTLSQALRQRGWKSVLIFSRPVNDFMRPHFDNTGAILRVLSTGSGRLQFYTSLMRILLKSRPVIVHLHFFNHFSPLPVLVWLARPKLVLFTEHVCRPEEISVTTRWKCWLWDRMVLGPLGIRVTAVSDYVKRTLVNSYQMSANRIEVIYNGVNLRRFSPENSADRSLLRSESALPPNSLVVTCVAALIPQKGVSDLLIAAQLILKQQPNVFFVIVGEGPLLVDLREQAKRLDIRDNVRFTGLRSDVNRFIAMCDVLAVPSIWQEPAGLVTIEGMASSRPVVATRVGGIPEYVEDGAVGILVEPHSPEQLASALLRILNSPETAEAMGRAGRSRAEAQFSMDKWVGETLKIYESAVEDLPSKPINWK